jgi:hypothetical protein
VREFLAQNNITMLPHPQYSPEVVPCDLFLFPKLKTHHKGHHFGTVENVQVAVTRTLNNISSEYFQHCYEEWQKRWNRCIRSQGAYFEGDKLYLHICLIKKNYFKSLALLLGQTSYTSEISTLTERDRKHLNIFDRKVYKRILGPVYGNEKENWRILTYK